MRERRNGQNEKILAYTNFTQGGGEGGGEGQRCPHKEHPGLDRERE